MPSSVLTTLCAVAGLGSLPLTTFARTSSSTPMTARESVTADEKVAEPDILLQKPVLQLNQYTFNQNVLEEDSINGVHHWIILFCLQWLEPCEIIDRPFLALAGRWQAALNTDLFATEVRFAYVDCATDRVLCNEQFVEEYPMLLHYHQQEAVNDGPVGRALNHGPIRHMVTAMREWTSLELSPILDSRSGMEDSSKEEVGLLDWARSMVPERRALAVDVGVVVLALLGNAWLLLRGFDSSSKPAVAAASEYSCGAEAKVAEPEDVAAVGRRILPESWANERQGVEF